MYRREESKKNFNPNRPNNSYKKNSKNDETTYKKSSYHNTEKHEHIPFSESVPKIKDQIITTVKENINTDNVSYRIHISDKKMESGSLVITFKLQPKDGSKSRILIFAVNGITFNDRFNLSILSMNSNETHMLFSCTEKDLEPKLTKYVPRIIESTSNMLLDTVETTENTTSEETTEENKEVTE